MSEEKYELAGYKIRLFLYRDRWALDISKGKARKIKSLKTKDLAKARDEFYRYKLQLKEKGRLDIVFDTDLFRQIEIFLEWSKSNTNSPRTYKRHEETIRKFLNFITQYKIDKITPSVHEKFKAYLLGKGLSPRTVDIHLTTIGKLITVLEILEIVPKAMYARPKLIRAKRAKAPQFWTEEEIDLVLDKTRNSYLKDMIIFGLNTGLRRGELVHLRWEDVNLEDSFVLVQGYEIKHNKELIKFEPKDHEVRRIKLNGDALDVLIRLKKQLPRSPWIFPNQYGRIRKNDLDRDLRVFLKKAKVQDKGSWHAIRRSFATHLLMAGADLESVRQLLGHSEIKTTMAYLNVTGRHLDETVDLIGFGGKKKGEKVIPFKRKG